MNRHVESEKTLFWNIGNAFGCEHCGKVSDEPQSTKGQSQIIRIEGWKEWGRIIAIAIATIVAVIVVAIF
ncbi:hypothetical protein OAG71_02495 [bacterium]|nr:hypothetical protein [bacterium]